MAWTEEMVEQLRQMWIEGLTANEIAKRLGVSKNSIVGKVHRLCLKARPSPIKRKKVTNNETAENKSSTNVIKEKASKVIPVTASVSDNSKTKPVKAKEVKAEKTTKANTKSKEENNSKETDVPAQVKEKKLPNGHIKLMQLDSHTCRWPLGDPRDEDFCFCGKKVRMGQTYCDEHSAMAYVKATKK